MDFPLQLLPVIPIIVDIIFVILVYFSSFNNKIHENIIETDDEAIKGCQKPFSELLSEETEVKNELKKNPKVLSVVINQKQYKHFSKTFRKVAQTNRLTPNEFYQKHTTRNTGLVNSNCDFLIEFKKDSMELSLRKLIKTTSII